jgi:AcrR family transcriptional regulator
MLVAFVNGCTHEGGEVDHVARRTADEAERTREDIVRAARELFTARGFAGTSTSAVVEAAGVTRGALYHHFGDKAALFREVFAQLDQELDDTVRRAALASDTAVDAFAAGCRALLDYVVRPDYHQIAVVDAPSVLGAETWHAIDAGLGLASVELGLKAICQEGSLRVPATPALAVAVYGALTEAGIVLSRGSPGAPSRDELIDAVLGLLVDRP